MPWDMSKWDPFRDLVSLRDEVDRLFRGYVGRFPGEKGLAEEYWYPMIDLEETPDAVVVTAEIPGMKKKDISISIRGNQLSIFGERKREKKEKGKTYHRIERSYGVFRRSVTLPTDILLDQAKASYKDGLLRITLPKAEKRRPREIAIDVK